MSVGDEPVECPLCMEPLEIDDVNFFPCTCGYQICRFCWHRIRTDENGLCPACRKQYPEDPAEFRPLTDDELQNIRKERKQKECQRKQKAAENRKHLANVRVVQKNLVFVVGLSPRLADPEVLKKHDYFGKFGKIHKVVINQSTSYAGSQGPSASAYVTYIRLEDALRAILAVNNVHVDGRTLKTSLGTTKYCSHFLRGSQCMKSDCMYLHELGEEAASFTKEEMQMGKHQEYEQKLIEQFLNAQNSANNHVSNNKIQNRKKSNSPSAQQQINQQHSPPLSELGGLGNNKLPQLLTPAVQQGSNASGDSLQTANSPSEAWPSLLPGIGGNTSGTGKQDCLTNYNRSASSNSLNIRTTPPIGKTFGNGRHRSASENQQSQDNVESDDDSTSGSPVSHQKEPAFIENQAPRSSSSSFLLSATSSQNQGLLSPADDSALQLPQSPPPLHMSLPLSLSQPIVMPIGTNRRLSGFPPAANSLSFFSNNIGSGKVAVPHSVQSQERTDSLPPSEMSDSILVSSSTDWSEAFGFKSKETTDDDLGFDPCAESFKGLADLIEKENGQNGQWNQGLAGSLSQEQQHAFAGHLSQHLPSSLGLLQSSQHSLPPGFSLSHIQQQHLHQHLFRPDLGANRMMDFQPYSARPRFPSVHNNFHHSGHDISPNLTHHHIPHSGSLPQTQLEFLNMKDMQEQLRSLLPNINISFGSPPQPLPPPGVTHTLPAIVQNGSDVSWVTNDPAILGLRPFREDAPHWLKSIHQLTESDSPVQNHSRLPFVQQFPIGPAASWPPQTQNPPPGFRNPVRPPAAEPHKLAEALQ